MLSLQGISRGHADVRTAWTSHIPFHLKTHSFGSACMFILQGNIENDLANSHSNNSHQSTIRIWFENITILHKCSGNDNYTLGRDNDPKRRSRIILHATVCCSLPRHILPLQKQSTTPGLSPRKSVKHLYIKTLKNTTTFQLPYTQAFTIANPIKL